MVCGTTKGVVVCADFFAIIIDAIIRLRILFALIKGDQPVTTSQYKRLRSRLKSCISLKSISVSWLSLGQRLYNRKQVHQIQFSVPVLGVDKNRRHDYKIVLKFMSRKSTGLTDLIKLT